MDLAFPALLVHIPPGMACAAHVQTTNTQKKANAIVQDVA